MKLHWFVFVTLIGMCLAVGAAFLAPTEVVLQDGATEQVVSSSGFEHERFSTMRHGGPGAERHATTLWIGWAFVVFQVLFFGGCLAMGMERRKDGGASLGPAKQPLIFGTLVLAAIFTALVFSYQRYATEETHTLFLGFPRPTAWVFYAVWPFPVFFMIVYMRIFDRWFFTEEDERKVAELAATQRKKELEAAGGDPAEAGAD
ncbi:MAG: hypothetical protein F4X59_07680 [Holophagales bacterium]|nr:hypothetical protein [Holophagales bacterium]MXX61554.1 hypothetical protein [Holophagales bacterium]MYC10001.1 hypothetical protein [Holophagales bacterium]MYI33134.1 hypothetical protein [Holophagales bacterium]